MLFGAPAVVVAGKAVAEADKFQKGLLKESEPEPKEAASALKADMQNDCSISMDNCFTCVVAPYRIEAYRPEYIDAFRSNVLTLKKRG